MINGHDREAKANGLTVTGTPADADTEASDLYGEYEHELASRLTELLKRSGPGPGPEGHAEALPPAAEIAAKTLSTALATSVVQTAATPAATGSSMLSGLSAPGGRGGQGSQASGGAGRIDPMPPQPPTLVLSGPRPPNDFADPPPIPLSRRGDGGAEAPSWLAEQVRSAAYGLVFGLVVIVPMVLILSGRHESLLSSITGSQRPAGDRSARLPPSRLAADETLARTPSPSTGPGAAADAPSSPAAAAIAAATLLPDAARPDKALESRQPREVPAHEVAPSPVATAPVAVGVEPRAEVVGPLVAEPPARSESSPAPAESSAATPPAVVATTSAPAPVKPEVVTTARPQPEPAAPAVAAAVVALALPPLPAFPTTAPPVSAPPAAAPAPAAVAPAPALARPPIYEPTAASLKVIADSERLIKAGDILAARALLGRAAAGGDAAAMLALGETFDPNMLAAWGARDINADVGTARLFYGRALAAGLSRAEQRLKGLD